MWLLDCRGCCMYVYKILHTRDMFPFPPILGEESQCVRVRSMYTVRTALCTGQVIKKKDAPCFGPNVSADNGPRWRLKDTLTAAIFCCKGTDQHVRIRSMYVNVHKHPRR